MPARFTKEDLSIVQLSKRSSKRKNVSRFDDVQSDMYRGLVNEGMTCYMNSMLQTLFTLGRFRRAVYETTLQKKDSVERNEIVNCLQRIFYSLQTSL